MRSIPWTDLLRDPKRADDLPAPTRTLLDTLAELLPVPGITRAGSIDRGVRCTQWLRTARHAGLITLDESNLLLLDLTPLLSYVYSHTPR